MYSHNGAEEAVAQKAILLDDSCFLKNWPIFTTTQTTDIFVGRAIAIFGVLHKAIATGHMLLAEKFSVLRVTVVAQKDSMRLELQERSLLNKMRL